MKAISLLVLYCTSCLNAAVIIGGQTHFYAAYGDTNYISLYTQQYTETYYDIVGNNAGNKSSIWYTDIPAYQYYKGSTSTNILITYKQGSSESLESATIANNLWGGNCQLLEISNVGMTTQTDSWGASSADFTYFTCWEDAQVLKDNYITPVTNYLGIHPEIKYVANSFDMPYKDFDGGAWHESLIFRFYDYSNYSWPLGENNDVYVFSFGCRTFNDTTNLLTRTAVFDVWDTNGWYVQDDCPDTYHSSFPAGNWVIDAPGNVLYEDDSSATTNIDGNIQFLLHNGFHAGYRDDCHRTLFEFDTLPNSICFSIESYNFLSFRKGTTRTHQSRLFDCFDKDCNGGNYDKIFGCAAGHTREPAWILWVIPKFLTYCQQSNSFIEALYRADWVEFHNPSHIVCGHPFIRILP